METKSVVRNNYLDWLRVLAILMVFVYHSSRFFNLEDWHVKNPTTYYGVEVWNFFASTWMMPLIFVISGASLFYAIGKGGFGKFAKDKALRLLVPLVVCIFTHASLQVYLERITHGDFSGSYFQFLPNYFQGSYEGGDPSSGNFSWSGMHLWYLEWLFLFSILLYPLMRWLKKGGQRVLSGMSSFFTLPGAAYLLALPAVLLLALLDPDGPIMSQKEAGWSLVIYLWLIICGFVVVSNSHLQASIQQQRWISLALALVSSGIGGYLVLSQGDMAYGTPLYAILFGLRGFCSWCWVLAFLGLGMRYLNFRQPFLDFANEAVLPFYILHQTILLGVGYFVVQWNAPDLLRWVVILVLSFIIIMVLYEYLIRRFNLLRVLFGMKALPRRSSVQSIEPGLKEAV